MRVNTLFPPLSSHPRLRVSRSNQAFCLGMKLGRQHNNTGERLQRRYAFCANKELLLTCFKLLFVLLLSLDLTFFSLSFHRRFTRSADKIISCSIASSPVQLWKRTALGFTKVFIETFLYQRRITLKNFRNALTLLTVVGIKNATPNVLIWRTLIVRCFQNPNSRLYNYTDVKTSSRSSDSNRSPKPLKALTPGCFKSKTDSFPRTSTPVNSTINRRTSDPRPQFITPYRKQQATRDVSPLARCSVSSALPASDPSEGQVSGVKEPSPKKPRLSAPNGTLNTGRTHCGDASKVSLACS